MTLLESHRLQVSEGNHPHHNGLAKYVFVTNDGALDLVIRVTMKGENMFVTDFQLRNPEGRTDKRQAEVRLQDGSVIAKFGTDYYGDHQVKDVRTFAEKEFFLVDSDGKAIEMVPKSSKPTVLEELGFTTCPGVACM